VRKRQKAKVRRFNFKKELRSMNKLTILGVFAAVSLPIMSQPPPTSVAPPQIPTLQVCNLDLPSGTGTVSVLGAPQVHIPSRVPGGFTGNVTISVRAGCDPNTGFPVGTVALNALSMNDTLPGLVSISSVHIDQITSTGFVNPTAYMSGQCMAQIASTGGTVVNQPCHFWIMFVSGATDSTNNVPGPNSVSFLVFANTGTHAGQRIAYATGAVTAGSGTIEVTQTNN
jgi:hypothetical protein